MEKVYLFRAKSDSAQTLGALITGETSDSQVFTCRSLELPWLDNKNDVSCIPEGEYLCKWTRSPRLSTLAGQDVFTYEITGVPGRTGIRIHSANYFSELKGCIALGDTHKDINNDGHNDTLHSGNTVKQFNTILNARDFMLVIKSLS